jgi:hypothetical protein
MMSGPRLHRTPRNAPSAAAPQDHSVSNGWSPTGLAPASGASAADTAIAHCRRRVRERRDRRVVRDVLPFGGRLPPAAAPAVIDR